MTRSLRGAKACRSVSSSPWDPFDMAPPDPIIGLGDAYRNDPSDQKVIVGVGAYRGDDGKPHVLPCVREAEAILAQQKDLNHEYLGMVRRIEGTIRMED